MIIIIIIMGLKYFEGGTRKCGTFEEVDIIPKKNLSRVAKNVTPIIICVSKSHFVLKKKIWN